MKDDSFDELPPEIPDKLFFRIGEAATLIGVETHVLRYWETEFKLRPQRSDSGQRMYRRKDLGKFLRIKQLLHDEGFTIAGARKALEDGGAEAAPVVGDSSRIAEALDKVQEARLQIRDLRDRISAMGVASRGGGS